MRHPFIMVAPNGARRGKADHPALPVTLAETTQTARACYEAGAQGLHLHIRDEEAHHSLDPGRYREALDELAIAVPGMRVQITTESAGLFDVETQLTCLQDVRPGWASVSVREIARAPDLAARVYATCAANGTEVQHILYDTDDVALLRRWQADGTVRPEQDSAIFVLGRYGAGQTSVPADLTPFLRAMPGRGRWMVCAFGPGEHECLSHAAALGGDVRVGFENNMLAADGQPWRDNASSVAGLIAQLERKAA